MQASSPQPKLGDTISLELADQSYDLLGAVPCTIREDTIEWRYPELTSRIFGTKTELLPLTRAGYDTRLSASDRHARRAALANLTWDGARYELEYAMETIEGRQIWIEECGIRIAQGHIHAIMRDITHEKKRDQAKVYEAGHDGLTQLWNRSRMADGLSYVMAASKRFVRPAAFLRLSLSNLGAINEAYGYDIGDQIIKNVAARLQSRFPAPDLLARMGGHSFGIVLCDCSADEMTARAHKIRGLVCEQAIPSPHGELYAELDMSGVAISPLEAVDAETVFLRARAAMNTSKGSGGPLIIFDPEHSAPIASPETMTVQPEDIINALNAREISLAYQPIVDAKTRALHHYECLLRLKREDGEMISAGRFIMAAEKLGLVHLLDRRALELASDTLSRFPDVRLALNVSAATVKDFDSHNAYLAALRALGPATARLTLELTETVALDDPAMASRFSMQARTLGCEFAIDDFGSGYTTFQNLMAIEADAIKIDGSFIRDLSTSPHKQTFVRMLVDLAQTFGVRTVAEMVETPVEADMLKRFGVDYLQGYMFGVPSAAPVWAAS